MKLSLASIFGKEHATSVQGYKDISKKGGCLCAGRMAARGLAEGGENQGKTQTRDTM